MSGAGHAVETMNLPDKEIQSLIELGTGEVLEYDKSQTMVDLFVEQII